MQDILMPTEGPGTSAATEADEGLLVTSQLPNSILSGEDINADDDGDGDGDQITTELYSGESDDTGSNKSICNEILTAEAADSLQDVV
jgi:hypothetical protein